MKQNHCIHLSGHGNTLPAHSDTGARGKAFRRPLSVIFYVIVLLCSAGLHWAEGASTVSISEGDEWQYLTGAEEPPFKWNYPEYDASSWPKGRTGMGYGGSMFRTLMKDMKGNYLTVYARREFPVRNPSNVKKMTLRVRCDGPFTAFVNGIEVISNNEPVEEDLDISGFAHMLLKGSNVLAVQCSNNDIHSDDFFFTPLFEVHED